MTEKNYFNNEIANSEHFIDMPDCISDGESYRDTLGNSFKITNGILELNDFSWNESETEYLFEMKVNNAPYKISVKKMSDYVDSNGLVEGLNEILNKSGYSGEKYFCDINGGVADFGIAFISKEKEIKLARSGMIWRNDEFYHKVQTKNVQTKNISENANTINIENQNAPKAKSSKPWWKFWE